MPSSSAFFPTLAARTVAASYPETEHSIIDVIARRGVCLNELYFYPAFAAVKSRIQSLSPAVLLPGGVNWREPVFGKGEPEMT